VPTWSRDAERRWHIAQLFKEITKGDFGAAVTRLDRDLLPGDDVRSRADWDMLLTLRRFELLEIWKRLREDEAIDKSEEKDHVVSALRPHTLLPNRPVLKGQAAELQKKDQSYFIRNAEALRKEIQGGSFGDYGTKHRLELFENDIRNYFRSMVVSHFPPDFAEWSESEEESLRKRPATQEDGPSKKLKTPQTSQKRAKSPVKSAAKSASQRASSQAKESAAKPTQPKSSQATKPKESPIQESQPTQKFTAVSAMFDLQQLQAMANKRSQTQATSSEPEEIPVSQVSKSSKKVDSDAEEIPIASRQPMYMRGVEGRHKVAFDHSQPIYESPKNRRETQKFDAILKPLIDDVIDDNAGPSIPGLSTDLKHVKPATPLRPTAGPSHSHPGPSSSHHSKRGVQESDDDHDDEDEAEGESVKKEKRTKDKTERHRQSTPPTQFVPASIKQVGSVLDLDEAQLIERAARAAKGGLRRVPEQYRSASNTRIRIPWTPQEMEALRLGLEKYVLEALILIVRHWRDKQRWAKIKAEFGAPEQALEYRSAVDLKDKARNKGFEEFMMWIKELGERA